MHVGRRVSKKYGTCRHPNCNENLTKKNKSGVCSRHLHKSACRCENCIQTKVNLNETKRFKPTVPTPPWEI